ncbi:hypothetical protein ACS0TY_016376 [Phlomoides rotata]
MPKHRHRGMIIEGLTMPTKTRKRGCSSSSSSSSRIRNYRLNKRAIVVGKSRAGLGIRVVGSRSTTPVPAWRNTPSRTAVESPKYSQSGKSTQPVSARRLAATLWEMNETPSPRMIETNLKLQQKKREKLQSGFGLHSSTDSLPPNLSDPSHSPTISEMDRSGMSSRLRTPSIAQKLRSAEQNAAVFDAITHASLMETETRSRAPTSSGSISGSRNRLKDVSNALTTSKELLRIINRLWAHANQPSSSMSVISALHTELERARLQVNHLIQEQHTDKNEINHLMKRFAEEKLSWKNKEHQAIEAAIASIASELEVERKLRRRFESLNKKLGNELAETKTSFMKAVKELESEKRAREITEQMCDELARNIDEDRAEVEELKSEAIKVHEEAEKEREMLELADKVRESRAQMKLSEAKHQFEEKNSKIGKLRKQLEVFLGTKRDKDETRGLSLSKSSITSYQNEQHDDIDSKDDAEESHKWGHESKGRSSVSRGSTSLQRAVSDGVEFGGLERPRFVEHEKEAHRRSCYEERQGYKHVKGLHNHVLSSPRLSSSRECYSPSMQREQSRPCRDPLGMILERQSGIQALSSKSRMGDVRGEGQSGRRPK